MTDKPSQIPVPVSKRASLSLSLTPNNSILQSSTAINQPRSGSTERSASPLLNKPSPNPALGTRRNSLLNSTGSRNGSRKASVSDSEDPVHLKAQINLLQSALQASHSRIVELCQSAGINASLPSSPGDRSSPLPWTPLGGTLDLPDLEAATPELGVIEDEEENESTPVEAKAMAVDEDSPLQRLPKSNSSYDLRSRAQTPKTSDGKLGLSQIPRAAVQHHLSLHPSPKASPIPSPASLPPLPNSPLASPFFDKAPYESSAHSNGRLSPLPGGMRKSSNPSTAASTRVIDSLQTELLATKGHLERVKQEMRSSQRVIGSLTRQTEDLKETKERMRVECEGLNNVIARKERLLQEVLDRARTAESSLANLQSSRKALEQSTKKQLSQMTQQLVEAQEKQTKAESECGSLRDSVRSLKDVWGREVRGLKEEMRKGEERWRGGKEEARNKHMALVKLIQAQSADRTSILELTETASIQTAQAKLAFETEVKDLRGKVDESEVESREAKAIAVELAGELERLRRLMREPMRRSLGAEEVHPGESGDLDGTSTE